MMKRTLDNKDFVYFYEQEFYVLSNFSAFQVDYGGMRWMTSEHCYQAQKFPQQTKILEDIIKARSAHEAFKIAESNREFIQPGWEQMKLQIMKNILIAKLTQHEYVYRKLMETGDRTLVENSWRDGFWGEGPDRQGSNHLGKLWMEIRSELKAAQKQLEVERFSAPSSMMRM